MNGKMLWFNSDKGFGFIETAQGERLYVAEGGFMPGQVPVGRCAGLDVVFERVVDGGEPRAINALFPPEADTRRARRRQGGSARAF
jgi:hypothetical protein